MDLLEALGVVWLADDGRAPAWDPSRLELLAAPLQLRTPWSGLASAFLWAIFVAVGSVVVWFQDVAVGAIIAVIVGVWLLLTVSRITATLSVDHNGVTVRNTFSRRRLAWDDIAGIGIATPYSIWNLKLTSVMSALAFRVHGRRSLVKAAGSATLSHPRLVEELAAVRPWCLASGTPTDRSTGDLNSPLSHSPTPPDQVVDSA